jgi:hypothetical protein
MRRPTLVLALVSSLVSLFGEPLPALRYPATPLIAHDPYFSIWSLDNKLTDGHTRHWTGKEQHLTGMAWIDNKAYRFMGAAPRELEVMEQKSVEVTPTRTIYVFEKVGVRLKMTFLTPALPEDLDVLARPLTYVVFETVSTDDRDHEVSIYFDASSLLAVNSGDQPVVGSRLKMGDMQVVRVGTQAQNMLAKTGDDLRIDWGYAYVAVPNTAPNGEGSEVRVRNTGIRADFAKDGAVDDRDEFDTFAPNTRVFLSMAAVFKLKQVRREPVTRYAMVAYDDLYSVQYFNRNLRPYWRRTLGGGKAMAIDGLLQKAAADFSSLQQRSEKFDRELTEDLTKAGGAKYAQIAILAYRQTLAAHKLTADADGKPMYFSKENASNGCIGTVDVTYPSSPFFLLLNPELLRAQLTPVLQYAQMPRWGWKYAPHDLGQYPLANGQVYGGGEKSEAGQMPVEESGNMLIMMAALAKVDGDAKWMKPYFPLLTKWAEYLRDKGFDPEDQLSTDDFAGKLARNANLSIKSIVALASYADLARRLDDTKSYDAYMEIARRSAKRWEEMAREGDHYLLAFGQPDTWSQKYNLVWDKLLGFGLFSEDVARREVAHYKERLNKYGVPLDNRASYTKLDWEIWSASLGEQKDFEALVEPVFQFLNDTPSRVPMTDWYGTLDGKQRGFQARSVVGGVYIKMLMDSKMWNNWADRAKPAPAASSSSSTGSN